MHKKDIRLIMILKDKGGTCDGTFGYAQGLAR